MADNDNEEEKQISYNDEEEQEGGIFRWMSVFVVLLAVAGFFGLAWYAYKSGGEAVDEKDVELIKADTTPVKEAPANPGGMQIPNQDKTVYGLINGGKAEKPTVERVLPAPEEPLTRSGDTETWMSDKVKKTASGNDSDKVMETPLTPVTPLGQGDTKKPEQFNPAKAQPGAGTQVAANSSSPSASAQPSVATPQPSPAAVTQQPKPAVKVVLPQAPDPAPQVKSSPAPQADNPSPGQQRGPIASSAPMEVDDEEEEKPAPPPAASPKGPRVQLGAYKSEAEAQSDWTKIARQFPAAAQKSHYILRADLGEKGVFYRLQLGPFNSSKDAEQFCGAFTSAGKGCFPAKAK